jgi:SHOCT-like protein
MHNGTLWELPFTDPAVLELHTEFGNLNLLPVEVGMAPRLELSRNSADVEVHIDRVDDVVRVSLDPRPTFNWFPGGWDCRATLYVPRDVRASLETSAGSVSVRNLEGCELGIKANAGKLELVDVYGLMHLAADAGSITGRGLGGYFDVEAQAGSVRLEILDLQPGEHRVRTSIGSLRIELGRGMDVCIETHTVLGSVRNQYPTRADAPARLVLSTEMGSVRVDEASMPRAPRRPAGVGADAASPGAGSGASAGGGVAEQSRTPRQDPELERILRMVESGELSATDADELLRAMGRV